jgi:hypothetical protein
MKTSLSQAQLGLESTNASDADDAVNADEADGTVRARRLALRA